MAPFLVRTCSFHKSRNALNERPRRNGLGEECLKPGIECTLTVCCVDMRTDGDGWGLPSLISRKCAHPTNEVISIVARHCDVRQDDLWPVGLQHGQSLSCTAGESGLRALRVEEDPHYLERVVVVVHCQDSRVEKLRAHRNHPFPFQSRGESAAQRDPAI
jgi:hypothetical protein